MFKESLLRIQDFLFLFEIKVNAFNSKDKAFFNYGIESINYLLYFFNNCNLLLSFL